MVTKKCKEMTKYSDGKENCHFDATIDGLCLNHWRKKREMEGKKWCK